MPWDNLPEALWEKMDSCVEQVKGEGNDEEAAIRICYASLTEKAVVTPAPIYAPEVASDVVAIYGDTIKAAPVADGVKLGGYLVRFGDPQHTDLVGDYFTKNTDFGDLTTSTVWLNHRMPVKTRRGTIVYDRPLTNKATLTLDKIGVYAEVLLTAREEYEAQIAQAGLKGALSWSSGTAAHLVDRKNIREGVNEIMRWHLGLDASLTPSPAEFRRENRIIPIKSLPTLALAEATSESNKEQTMDISEEIKTAVAAELAKRDAEAQVEAKRQAEIKQAEEAGYQKAITEVKAQGLPAFNRITELGFSEEKDAGPAFAHWIKTGQRNGALIPDPNYGNVKAAYNVTTGESGAYLVPDTLDKRIVAKRDLASWVRQAPVRVWSIAPGTGDHVLIPAENTSMTDFVLTAEAASYDEDEATFDQKDLILYNYTKLVKMSRQFVQFQATDFDNWLGDALGRAAAGLENTVSISGNGTGQPQGLSAFATASGLTIKTSAQLNPEDLTAMIGKLGGGYNIPAECGFVGANASKWYLKNAILSGPFAYTGTPAPEFFGYPFYVSDTVQSYTATSGVVLYFGNMNYFALGEVTGMSVMRNDYLFMGSGQIGLYANIYRGFVGLQAEAIYSVNGK